MRRSVFHDHECQGRITLEHVWTYAGRQINEPWAIIKLCSWAHSVDEFQDGGDLDKGKNKYISLALATADNLMKYPRKSWGLEITVLVGLDKYADKNEIKRLQEAIKPLSKRERSARR